LLDQVIKQEGIADDVAAVLHRPDKGNQTEIGYRLAWARTYLKKAGYIINSSHGVWALTTHGKESGEVDPSYIVRIVQGRLIDTAVTPLGSEIIPEDEVPDEVLEWREHLHHLLIHDMSADAFERLTQRLLRESGFVNVQVTGRTGDGGIDGKGIARINGLMSFHIAFQCKKYQGSVGAPEIRNFRGATIGVADRGLFITTGTYTKAAIEEANRVGAAPIDLVDGSMLADKLKELGLGIKTELVEKVTVDSDWFKTI
jgi:restriction system protein